MASSGAARGRSGGRAMPSPGLTWLPQRMPYAERFGDVYYSREGGLAETRHVFLGGCGLPDAWRNANLYTICELGFGTGLNFLATWEIWRRTRKFGARLHYIAVEGFPLTHSELNECLTPWPQVRVLAQSLLRVYPQPQAGFHRLFPKVGDGDAGSVCLTLLYGEAGAMLQQLEAGVDAWFLDGFAPDKNPDMWRPDIFAEMARLSRGAGTRVATYSVAGDVRRGLDAAGFETAKAAGFGAKREMLRGQFRGGAGQSPPRHLQPWFAHAPHAPLSRGHAAIVGAGIAGTSVAYALQRRGWHTTLIDRHDGVAAEASGNPVGVLMPRLTAAPNFDGRFYAGAWRFALETLEEISDAGLPIYRDRCGLLQLATDAAEEGRQAAIAAEGVLPEPLMFHMSAKEASDTAGVKLPYSALYFPQAGWLQPRDLCAALAGKARLLTGVEVASVQRAGGLWQVMDAAGGMVTQADAVIFANAMGAAALPYTAWLPLAARRGQITLTPQTPASTNLRSVLAFGGYLTPAHKDRHCLGATFDWVESDDVFAEQPVVESDHARNMAEAEAALPGLLTGVDAATLTGRAAIRCTTPDHLPAAGPVPDQGAYLRDYAELRHGHPWARYAEASYQPGLYMLAGLGARGLVAAPLAAEALACHMTGEPWPLERDVMTALHPGRFLVRDLKRLRA